jgi:hypothetical protein
LPQWSASTVRAADRILYEGRIHHKEHKGHKECLEKRGAGWGFVSLVILVVIIFDSRSAAQLSGEP